MQICASYIWLDHMVQKREHSAAFQAARYIEESYAQNLTIYKICSELNIGKTKLCNDVKTTYHMTVLDLITQKRIEAAKSYLCSTDYSINEIAQLCGINDYNYFIKIFKKHTGITPYKFRKNSSADSPVL